MGPGEVTLIKNIITTMGHKSRHAAKRARNKSNARFSIKFIP
jgi:hypothetical protein